MNKRPGCQEPRARAVILQSVYCGCHRDWNHFSWCCCAQNRFYNGTTDSHHQETDRCPKPVLHLSQTCSSDVDAWDTLHRTVSKRKWNDCSVANAVTLLELALQRSTASSRTNTSSNRLCTGSQRHRAWRKKKTQRSTSLRPHLPEQKQWWLGRSWRYEGRWFERSLTPSKLCRSSRIASPGTISTEYRSSHRQSISERGKGNIPRGLIAANIEYNSQQQEGEALVVKTNGPAFFLTRLASSYENKQGSCASHRQQNHINAASSQRVVGAPLCLVRPKSRTIPSLQ